MVGFFFIYCLWHTSQTSLASLTSHTSLTSYTSGASHTSPYFTLLLLRIHRVVVVNHLCFASVVHVESTYVVVLEQTLYKSTLALVGISTCRNLIAKV